MSRQKKRVDPDAEFDLDALSNEAEGKAPEEGSEELPPVTKLSVNHKDARGKTWAGEFVFHVPTLGDQVKIARLKAVMLPNGAVADPAGALITEMMAYLKVTLRKTPTWWKPETFRDATVLSIVYGEARAYEARFLGGRPDDRDGADEAQERPDAPREDDVERDVQDPPE